MDIIKYLINSKFLKKNGLILIFHQMKNQLDLLIQEEDKLYGKELHNLLQNLFFLTELVIRMTSHKEKLEIAIFCQLLLPSQHIQNIIHI
jgi:hypothetical protein